VKSLSAKACIAGVLLVAAGMAAQAQTPSAPLKIVVPYPAGGPVDASAHIVAEGAKAALGNVVVENKPGAGGNVGADLVAKAPAGGNLLVMGAVATHAVNPWLYKSFPYDPIKDFKPIALVARTPNVLVMSAEQAKTLGINSTTELVQYLKKHPDQLKYGSGGNGSIGHIAAEMFKSLTNTRMSHVPFQGSAPALKALQAQEVSLVFDNLASSLPLIKAGKLKALGVTSLGRDDDLPDVRSINDEVQGFNVVTWFGLFAPAALPDADARRYAMAFTAGMKSPASVERFKKMGLEPEDVTLESFGQFVRSEHSKYGFLIKAAKIKMD